MLVHFAISAILCRLLFIADVAQRHRRSKSSCVTGINPLHQGYIQLEVLDRGVVQPLAVHARRWRVLLFLFSFPFLFLSATCCCWLLLLGFGFRGQRAAFSDDAQTRQDDRQQRILPANPGVLLGARRTRWLLHHNIRSFKIWAVR